MSDQGPYHSSFHLRLLRPRYWGHWLIVLAMLFMAFIPLLVRDRLADVIASWMVNRDFLKKRRLVIRCNLERCFPDLSDSLYEQMARENVRAFCQTVLSLGELMWRSKKAQQRRIRIEDDGRLAKLKANGKPLLFLTPHTFGLDWTARALILAGFPMSNIFKPTGKPVFDYLMFKYRTSQGGVQFSRGEGMRTLVKSIRSGYCCLYVADQDHGMASSVFAPFFGTPKCTLPIMGRLAQAARAQVVPVIVGYDPHTHQFVLHVDEPLETLETDDLASATQMNRTYEKLISRFPADFMWSLKIFRNLDGTRPYPSPNSEWRINPG